MPSNLLYVLLLLSGFPTGIILAKLCKEELKDWKNRFIILIVISLILSILIYFIKFEFKIPVILTLLFVIITFLTIIWKSYNK